MAHKRVAVLAIGFIAVAMGATLSYVSDVITDSRSGVYADHTIQFTTITAIPISGKIVITPQAGYFTIPSSLDFSDIDLFIDSSEKTVAASAGSGSGSAFGVSVVSGTSGYLTVTLNDSDPIVSGSAIIIKISQIVNPASSGSYRVTITTKTSSNSVLDEKNAMIAITDPVVVSASKASPPAPTPAPAPSPVPVSSQGGYGGSSSGNIPTSVRFRIVDFNEDYRVDLVDFSILVFNWGIPKNPATDINRDKVVDLVDFSTLLYWWTG